MSDTSIRFDDGAGYERMMGQWSQLVGEQFLDWLAAPAGARWLDVGCGNGAFTQLIVDRCQPAEVHGVDPSEAQLAYARQRPAGARAEFHRGGAEELPFPAARFDVAVMALVIFFVPDPARGVAELRRVVRPGGLVASYSWDMFGSAGAEPVAGSGGTAGFPLAALREELAGLGVETPRPPSDEASRPEALRALWEGAGLLEVEARTVHVRRTFRDFEDYWEANLAGTNTARLLQGLSADDTARLRARLRARLGAEGDGPLTLGATANALRGRVPG